VQKERWLARARLSEWHCIIQQLQSSWRDAQRSWDFISPFAKPRRGADHVATIELHLVVRHQRRVSRLEDVTLI
jgi:hypothetical protein